MIEAIIYTIIVNGRFLRYRDEFDDALIQLSIARSLLDSLAGAATTSRDQALAILFADEIAPEIRHCAHEMGHAKAYDIDGIVAQLTHTQKNAIVEDHDGLLAELTAQVQASNQGESKKKLQGIVWEGQAVPVRNPELVDVLLKVQDGEARLSETQSQAPSASKGGVRSKKGIAAYDATLLALSDAEEVARKLSEAQQVFFLRVAPDQITHHVISSLRPPPAPQPRRDVTYISYTRILSTSFSATALNATCS